MAIAALGASGLGFSQVAYAQEISKGLNIASVTAGYARASVDEISVTDLKLTAGLENLLTSKISAGALLNWHREGSGYGSDSTAELALSGAYYFKSKTYGSPYASVRFGLGLTDDKPQSIGVGVGYLRLMGSKLRGAGVKGEIGYLHESHSSYSGEAIFMTVGVSFYFRRNPDRPAPQPGQARATYSQRESAL